MRERRKQVTGGGGGGLGKQVIDRDAPPPTGKLGPEGLGVLEIPSKPQLQAGQTAREVPFVRARDGGGRVGASGAVVGVREVGGQAGVDVRGEVRGRHGGGPQLPPLLRL